VVQSALAGFSLPIAILVGNNECLRYIFPIVDFSRLVRTVNEFPAKVGNSPVFHRFFAMPIRQSAGHIERLNLAK